MYSRVICYSCTYWTWNAAAAKNGSTNYGSPVRRFFQHVLTVIPALFKVNLLLKIPLIWSFLPVYESLVGLQLLHYGQTTPALWHEWRRQLLLRKMAIIFRSDVSWDHGRDKRIYIVYQWSLFHCFKPVIYIIIPQPTSLLADNTESLGYDFVHYGFVVCEWK